MSGGSARRRREALVRLGSWVAVTYLGFATFGDIHLQAVGPTARVNLGDFEPAFVGFMFGAVSGAIIGALQWLVLRSWAPRARGWIPASIVGFGLAHALNDSFPYRPLDLLAMLLIGGLMIAIPQAIALRRVLARPWTWVPVATVAWIVGQSVGAAIAPLIVANPLGEMLIGIGSAGLIFGTITGLALLAQIGVGEAADDDGPLANPALSGDAQQAR